MHKKVITGNDMKRIISDLYLKDRTIVCDDYDYCLQYLKDYLDFTIHEFKSGETYWNWVIPDKYTVRKAYIKDVGTGKVIVDAKDHPMRLASYSAPFEGILDFSELKKRLFWNEKVPEGIPNYHKLQYRPWEKDWKFCVSYNELKRFKKDGRYEVKVDTIFEKGAMKVAEFHKKGKTNDTILLVAHLDHPGQANDGLSGVVAELALMQSIAKRDTYYSYTFLVVQEFLGSVAYLSRFQDTSNLKMGIFAEMLSTGLKLQLQTSFFGNAYIDKISEAVFSSAFKKYDILPYLTGAGNDEIVFESPGIEVPFVSIMRARSKGRMYREYHTSLDNMDLIDERQLNEAHGIMKKIIDMIEMDCYVMRNFHGFPCLSNPDIGLYFNANDYSSNIAMDNTSAPEGMYAFLFGGFRYLDGRHRISDIAIKYGVPFDIMLGFIKKMEERKLLKLSHDIFSQDIKT
ncbi:MAG: DUF4910 domain-containing protein [Candidatus Omnitrophota bacterium]|jgi:aminopeptidase-like protein